MYCASIEIAKAWISDGAFRVFVFWKKALSLMDLQYSIGLFVLQKPKGGSSCINVVFRRVFFNV